MLKVAGFTFEYTPPPHTHRQRHHHHDPQFLVNVSNVVIIDDTPEKCENNPPYTSVHPSPWSVEGVEEHEDGELASDGGGSGGDDGGTHAGRVGSGQSVDDCLRVALGALSNSGGVFNAEALSAPGAVGDLSPNEGRLWRFLRILAESELSSTDFLRTTPYGDFK